MNAFAEQSFGLLVLKEGLEGIIDELSFVNIGHEGLEILIVVVDGFEELEEAIDDLHVRLAETFI